MIQLLICCLAGITVPSESSEYYGRVGYYASMDYFQGDSSGYGGLDAGMMFSPLRWTEVGLDFNLLSNGEYTFTFVNFRAGLFSPRLWKLRALAGGALRIRVTAPHIYNADCIGPGYDPAMDGGFMPYLGLNMLVFEKPSGMSLCIESRVYGFDGIFRRITAGCTFSRPI